MEYTIQKLASLAGVSTRTLRWYDQIGLLKPCRCAENDYRIYGPAEVDRLQQILFYRTLGVELARIRTILDEPSFDRLEALRGHLNALQAERDRIDGLIHTVRQTIATEERSAIMSDQAKFEGFQRRVVERNEAAYGAEIRTKYGDGPVDEANTRVLSLTREQYQRWTGLGEEIKRRLTAAVTAGEDPAGEEGQAIAALHREWLTVTNNAYRPDMHAGLGELYTQDERFTAYYDGAVSGCADFLCRAIHAFTGR